ncbi:MAG: hypothetical protein H7333_03590 [Bdellovibrionales bacterium]|nr:hypothetical protein [Oligoflexia bacterium]
MEFSFYIGIDQTGAVNAKGVPHPLQASLIDARTKKIRTYTGIRLETLSRLSILELIRKRIPEFKAQRVLICIDTVFGLPRSLKVTPETVFKKIEAHEHNGKPYGALTAHAFFNKFLKDEQIEHRTVEKRVKANSVFKLKPFQRNIGCGSYRIIKNLAQDKKWFSLWPFEKASGQFVIAEGYPSHFWKELLGAKKRDLAYLKDFLPNLTFATMDEADSFMLAYGAMKSIGQLDEQTYHPDAAIEGWILGVPFSAPTAKKGAI